jgi:hypothetical protein
MVPKAFLIRDEGQEGLVLDHGATAGAAHEYDIAEFHFSEPTAPPVKVKDTNSTFFILLVLRYQGYVVALLIDS